jgi:hypothetical protein
MACASGPSGGLTWMMASVSRLTWWRRWCRAISVISWACLVGEHCVVEGTGVVVVMLVPYGAQQAANPARRIVVMMVVMGFAVTVPVVVTVLVVTVTGRRADGRHGSGTGRRPGAIRRGRWPTNGLRPCRRASR